MINVEIQGLAELRARLKGAHKTIEAEFAVAERDGLQALRDEARNRAPGNKLRNSITIERPSALAGIVGSVARTGLSIETGRPPGPMPQVELIQAWMGRSGIVSEGAAEAGATVSVKTHRVTKRRSRSVAQAQRALAWRISMQIKARGTAAQPFIGPSLPAQLPNINRLFGEAVKRALTKIAK